MLAACWHVIPARVLRGSLGAPRGALGAPVGALSCSLWALWGFSGGSRVGLGATRRSVVVIFLPEGSIVGAVGSSRPFWGSFCSGPPVQTEAWLGILYSIYLLRVIFQIIYIFI